MITQIAAQLNVPGYSIPYPTGLNVAKFKDPGAIISSVLPLIYSFSGLILLAFLVFGGLQYLTSGGDPKATQQAQEKITAAVIGFIIVFVSFWVFQIAGVILGIDFFS